MPSISFIVARSYPGNVIGCENKLPWRLKTDMKRFRQITLDHAVIMGSKTFDSIGKPLPRRTNIVMSREARPNESTIVFDKEILWANTLEAAIYIADLVSIVNEKRDFFVIGGAEIYRLFFDQDLINKVYLTEVFAADVIGDAYFKDKFPSKQWKILEEVDYPPTDEDQYGSRFIVYERKERRYRSRFVASFFTETFSKADWVSSYIKTHDKEIKEYEENHQFDLPLDL